MTPQQSLVLQSLELIDCSHGLLPSPKPGQRGCWGVGGAKGAALLALALWGAVGSGPWSTEPWANVEQDHPWTEPLQPDGCGETREVCVSGLWCTGHWRRKAKIDDDDIKWIESALAAHPQPSAGARGQEVLPQRDGLDPL